MKTNDKHGTASSRSLHRLVRCPICDGGGDDQRLAILREAPTSTLTGLIEEILDTETIGCSVAFFALGMSPEFRATEPAEMLELIFHVLRERLPND